MFKGKLKIVDSIRVESPCPVPDFDNHAQALDQGWYCHHCEKEVYDLASMTREEIAKLIDNTGGHFCALVSHRQDGSIVTGDPVSRPTALIAAGALMASTTLIASTVLAESEINFEAPAGTTREIDPPLDSQPQNPPLQMLGEVYITPSPTPEVSKTNSQTDKSSSQSEQCTDKAKTSSPIVEKNQKPRDVPRTLRGKVAVTPRR